MSWDDPLTGRELVEAQPMTAPTGRAFEIEFRYTRTRGSTLSEFLGPRSGDGSSVLRCRRCGRRNYDPYGDMVECSFCGEDPRTKRPPLEVFDIYPSRFLRVRLRPGVDPERVPLALCEGLDVEMLRKEFRSRKPFPLDPEETNPDIIVGKHYSYPMRPRDDLRIWRPSRWRSTRDGVHFYVVGDPGDDDDVCAFCFAEPMVFKLFEPVDFERWWRVGEDVPRRKYRIVQNEVRAEAKKLDAQWTVEAAEDLEAYHDEDLVDEFIRGAASVTPREFLGLPHPKAEKGELEKAVVAGEMEPLNFDPHVMYRNVSVRPFYIAKGLGIDAIIGPGEVVPASTFSSFGRIPEGFEEVEPKAVPEEDLVEIVEENKVALLLIGKFAAERGFEFCESNEKDGALVVSFVKNGVPFVKRSSVEPTRTINVTMRENTFEGVSRVGDWPGAADDLSAFAQKVEVLNIDRAAEDGAEDVFPRKMEVMAGTSSPRSAGMSGLTFDELKKTVDVLLARKEDPSELSNLAGAIGEAASQCLGYPMTLFKVPSLNKVDLGESALEDFEDRLKKLLKR